MNRSYKNCVTNIGCKVVKFISHLHTIFTRDSRFPSKTLKFLCILLRDETLHRPY